MCKMNLESEKKYQVAKKIVGYTKMKEQIENLKKQDNIIFEKNTNVNSKGFYHSGSTERYFCECGYIGSTLNNGKPICKKCGNVNFFNNNINYLEFIVDPDKKHYELIYHTIYSSRNFQDENIVIKTLSKKVLLVNKYTTFDNLKDIKETPFKVTFDNLLDIVSLKDEDFKTKIINTSFFEGYKNTLMYIYYDVDDLRNNAYFLANILYLYSRGFDGSNWKSYSYPLLVEKNYDYDKVNTRRKENNEVFKLLLEYDSNEDYLNDNDLILYKPIYEYIFDNMRVDFPTLSYLESLYDNYNEDQKEIFISYLRVSKSRYNIKDNFENLNSILVNTSKFEIFKEYFIKNIDIYKENVTKFFYEDYKYCKSYGLDLNVINKKSFKINLNQEYLTNNLEIPEEKVESFINIIDKDPLVAYSLIANRRKLTKKQANIVSKYLKK